MFASPPSVLGGRRSGNARTSPGQTFTRGHHAHARAALKETQTTKAMINAFNRARRAVLPLHLIGSLYKWN